MSASVLTLLYVPADRPDRVAKALASEADVVIVDLEDAVAPAHKDLGREQVARLLAGVDRPVQVRANHPATPWHTADVEVVAALPPVVGVRAPKVESADEVRRLASQVPGRALHLLIESALGVEHAFEIATASDQVATLGLGEADLRSDLRVDDDAGLAWVRSRIVTAARAARLPSPAMSAYPNVKDVEGLIASCHAGRALGFLGRAAIHPAQLAHIQQAFRPSEVEAEKARAVVARVGEAHTEGVGAIALEDGTFLDVAMVEQARAVLALTERTGPTPG
ncbi:CoA ester lyase [Georgenia sp. SYP-B2076]|uniref:HpcH/HpaI aldolase/citrate lyase family protein n=1 Tax=Georgenia sp. SYP-B2076 TaxID=2495881 RepID=UPI000F8CD773|nr:CoA ester lyase [Georgenia sp. SYP-B2076]